MKAVTHDRYGGPEVLRIEDVPVPTPAEGQVRVRIRATSVNLSDWEGLTGSPGYARMGGLRRPRRRILGSDIAGVVDAVGPGVSRFREGDEVYGDNLALMGGFAEYAVAAESALVAKPAELSFVQASTIPQAGAIAVKGTARAAGGRVLVNGAGGGSGAFAIQLAKRAGAHVTAVDNATKLDFMRSVGADEVVDYRAEDFTRITPRFDLVLDLVAHRSVFAYRRALAPRRRLPVRRRVRPLPAAHPHGRLAGRPPHRPLARRAGRAARAVVLHPARRPLRGRRGVDPRPPHLPTRPGGRGPRGRRRRAGPREGRRGDSHVIT